MEKWKPVPGFKKYYRISNFGRILRLKDNKILSGYIDKDGYKWIVLKGVTRTKIKFVHRLVAIAFIPNPEKKPEVNHLNGIKSDNHLVNLQWVTKSENEKHAWKIGLKHNRQIKNNPKRSTPLVQFNLNGELIKYWPSASEVQRILGYKKSRILKAAKQGNGYSSGYLWSLKNQLAIVSTQCQNNLPVNNL